jgi:DNA polymerase/3'-5' exonuclease PolX
MHVSIHHVITDTQKWEQVTKNMMAAVEQGRLPQGLKPLMYLPSADGRKADCLWEAESLEKLRSFLDREIGTSARNDYFQINTAAAFGLPGQEEMRKAA